MGGRSLSTLPTIVSRWDVPKRESHKRKGTIMSHASVSTHFPHGKESDLSSPPAATACIPCSKVQTWPLVLILLAEFSVVSQVQWETGVPILLRKAGFISISSCRDCKGPTEFPVIPFSSLGCLHHLYIFTDHTKQITTP